MAKADDNGADEALPAAPEASWDAVTSENTPEVPRITGTPPVVSPAVSGSLRFTAIIDAEFKDGVLTGIGFPVQYTAFQDDKGRMAVRSSFRNRR